MPNRILKESICTSEEIDSLSWFEEALFYRLLVSCDDYGRYDARPKLIKGRLFPLKDDVTVELVKQGLARLEATGLLYRYKSGEGLYLQICTWDKHQNVRARRSKYPEPHAEKLEGASLAEEEKDFDGAASLADGPGLSLGAEAGACLPASASNGKQMNAEDSTCEHLHALASNCMQMYADDRNCSRNPIQSESLSENES